ncbi:hypothetical protein METP2_01533 [Methanosarcinales archaeon]|nr:hypothetical protein [Candidatus Methanoperedens sp.]CAG0973425.1 hypothetical protein METP2_01533 [Methanosarcinales archaeon]
MFTIKTLIQLITILLATAGIYLAVHTTNILRSRIDIKTLGAKAFLNDSFFRDIWILLSFGCLLFLLNAIIQMKDILGSTLDENNIYLMQNLIVLGLMTCSVVSQYKWYQLVKLKKN